MASGKTYRPHDFAFTARWARRFLFILVNAIVLILSGIPSGILAQSVSYLHFGIEEGLPSTEVYQAFQDREGFMWFATDNGVARYDGHELKVFQGNEGLADPVIFGFYEDYQKRIWFRSYSGRLSYLKKSVIYKYQFNDTLEKICQHALLRSMQVDSLDQVWFTTDNFTGKITRDGHAVEEIADQNDFKFWKDGNDCNAIWLGKKYVSYGSTLYEIRDNSMRNVLQANEMIISLSVDRMNNLWIGYLNKDCERYQNADFSIPYTPPFLSGKIVTSLYQDPQLGYWITTLKSGVYFVPDFEYKKFKIPLDGQIRATVTGDGIVATNENGNLILIDGRTFAIKHSAQILDLPVIGLFSDSKQNVWVSTRTKSFLFDSALHLKKTNSVQAKSFYEDKHKHIWGIDVSRIIHFDSNGVVIRAVPMNTIHRSILRSDPYIIMSGRTGFDVFDTTFKLVASPAQFGDFKIPDIVSLTDSSLLIATIGNGFFITSKKDWSATHFTTGENFMARNIYSAKVLDSSLWLGTEKGIAIASLSSMVSKHPGYTLITEKSGLVANKVDQILSVNGSVWAISGNMASIIPRQHNHTQVTSTKFYLKSMLVNSTPVDPEVELIFDSDQNDVRIEFGFIDFTHSTLFIRSRLTKNDPWSYSTGRTLHYDKLAAGSYVLELEYSFDSTRWNVVNTGVVFAIRQHWYLRWYSLAFFMFLLLIVFYLFFRIRLSMLHEKNFRLNMISNHRKVLLKAEIETMEKERSRIAKDLHDGAGMGLTVLKLKLHQMFSKLKGMQAFQFPVPESDEILLQINSTIQEIRDTIYNLTPAGLYQFGLANSLRSYVQKNASDLNVAFEFHEEGSSVLEQKISLSCFRILQELISNSLKHSGATSISINFAVKENVLDILYQDNGTGFSSSPRKEGVGLLNIEARLDHVHGKMSFTSGSTGVTYRLMIPLATLPRPASVAEEIH